jgi:hypothetical protein
MKLSKNQKRLLNILNLARRNKMNLEVRANNKKLKKDRRLNSKEYELELNKNNALISKASNKKVKFFPKFAYSRALRRKLKKLKTLRFRNKIKGKLSSRK